MTTEKRDYSKLRPFDLEAFKAGKTALFIVGSDTPEVRTYAAGPDKDGRLCVSDQYGAFQFTFSAIEDYYMAPLAWVSKSDDEDVLWPVYKGDVLYWNADSGDAGVKFLVGDKMVRDGKVIEGTSVFNNGRQIYEPGTGMRPEKLTFTPPKVKRQIKLVAFIDDHGDLRWVREELFANRGLRVPLEDRVVEVEEPAGQEGGAQ